MNDQRQAPSQESRMPPGMAAATASATAPIDQKYSYNRQEIQNMGSETKSNAHLRIKADIAAIRAISQEFLVRAKNARAKKPAKPAAG